jgi:hypothetical protein
MSKKPIVLIETERPAPTRADILPTKGYSLEVDGKLKAQFATSESAFEAGIELKKKFPFIQVRVYDAQERTRTPVDMPDPEPTG